MLPATPTIEAALTKHATTGSFAMPPALHRDDGPVKTNLELVLIRALIVEAQDRSDCYDHQKLRALADIAAAHWGTNTGDVA